MQLKHIALVSETQSVTASALTVASAALQKQVMRDFAPVWNEQATVDAFAALEDVPLGYWPVIVRDDIGFPGAAGIHLDDEGQPFGLVQFSTTWQLTASHEVLEMLADPFGNRVVAGDSIKPGQGRVEYLVEVCDPSEAFQFGYNVNGIRVSDFYTPRYFDPVKTPGTRYSFTGAIKNPRVVLKDGYLSWFEPVSGHWWQQVFFGATKSFRDLGVITGAQENIRAEIDRRTEVPEKIHGLRANDARFKAVNGGARSLPKREREVATGRAALTGASLSATASSVSKAESWRSQIETLKTQYAPA